MHSIKRFYYSIHVVIMCEMKVTTRHAQMSSPIASPIASPTAQIIVYGAKIEINGIVYLFPYMYTSFYSTSLKTTRKYLDYISYILRVDLIR